MTKTLSILDYQDNRTEVTIPQFEAVATITIRVLTGDEVAIIEYKDGRKLEFDSSANNPRLIDYYDGEYDVYKVDKYDRLEDDTFKNRKSSYAYLYLG